MLRSIKPEIDLVLLDEQLLLRQRGLLRRGHTVTHAWPAGADSTARDGVTALLPRTARGRLHVYLPSSSFLFWRVPWLDASLDEPDTWQLAASLLKQDYGRSVDEMAFSLTPSRFQQARLACALPRATVAALEAAMPSGATLAGIHPLLSLAWPTLTGATRPLLYSEPGLAALYLPDADGPRLHTRRLHARQHADIGTTETMAALFGIAAPPQVMLQVKGAWVALTAPQAHVAHATRPEGA